MGRQGIHKPLITCYSKTSLCNSIFECKFFMSWLLLRLNDKNLRANEQLS